MIGNPTLGDNLQALEGAGYFDSLLSTLITIIFIAGGIIFVFMLLTGGVQWITAGGSKDGLENARKKISTAIVGLIILFSAYALIKLIENIFGISIININLD